MEMQDNIYITQEIVDRLQREYGIKYVEGMKITEGIRDAVGEIYEQLAKQNGMLSIGNSGNPSPELEEY